MNSVQTFNLTTRCALLFVLLTLSTGCRGPWSEGWKVSDMWSMDVTPWSDGDGEPQVPQRMLGSWTDTTLHQAGKTPQRGFGGRLIFYGEEKDKPVLVEGQLVVYAFDETQRDPTDNKPTRRYVFPADQVARRMSKTSLGPSYSFWLPWDDVGGIQTEVSLIARFEPSHGPLIMSEQTRHMLPGQTTPSMIASKVAPKLPAGVPSIPAATTLASLAEQAQATAADGSVRLASYDAGTGQPATPLAEQPTAAPSLASLEPPRRMTTTSISLPENFRITNNGVPQTVRAGEPVLPGNMIAQPGAPQSNLNSVSAPIAVPQPANYPSMSTLQPLQQLPQTPMATPGYMTLRQSPLGNGFVAPVGGQQFAQTLPMSNTVGQLGVPPAAPVMPGQMPLTTAAGWPTASYSAAAPTVGFRMDSPPPSSGYPPQTLPAQASPASR